MRISLEQAVDLINTKITPLPEKELPLEEVLGCSAARDITARFDQPPFPRSPYDGYALRSRDSAGASPEHPVSLRVVGKSYAGIPADCELKPGEAVRIMTGGVIPSGADCVIMQEKTDEGEDTVKICAALSSFENYCRRGEDFLSDEVLIKKGTLLNAPAVAVAACSGYDKLPVLAAARASIIATGDELKMPGEVLSPGQIYSSNTFMLSGRLAELGAPVSSRCLVSDKLEDICDCIVQAAERSDVVLTTGGVSVGAHDLIPAVLERLGAKTLFHGVSIKPGMPTALALLGEKPVLALSGNPFACSVAFELLGRPLLARLSGSERFLPQIFSARLQKDFDYHRNTRRFHRGYFFGGVVSIPEAQGNGQIKTMIGCNCIVELPAGMGTLYAGSEVRVYSMECTRYC